MSPINNLHQHQQKQPTANETNAPSQRWSSPSYVELLLADASVEGQEGWMFFFKYV